MLCEWECASIFICSVLRASAELWCKHAGSSVLSPQLSAGAQVVDKRGPLQPALPYQDRDSVGKLFGYSGANQDCVVKAAQININILTMGQMISD